MTRALHGLNKLSCAPKSSQVSSINTHTVCNKILQINYYQSTNLASFPDNSIMHSHWGMVMSAGNIEAIKQES